MTETVTHGMGGTTTDPVENERDGQTTEKTHTMTAYHGSGTYKYSRAFAFPLHKAGASTSSKSL
jgi:hypothetical protein